MHFNVVAVYFLYLFGNAFCVICNAQMFQNMPPNPYETLFSKMGENCSAVTLSQRIDNEKGLCTGIDKVLSLREFELCLETLGSNFMANGDHAVCMCKLLEQPSAQFSCVSGAYKFALESVNSKSGFWLNARTLHPCTDVVEFPAACYRHFWGKLTYHYPMRDAQIICLGINDKIHRHSCIHGVGYAYSSTYFSDQHGLFFPLNMMCSFGNLADKIMCIHGYWTGLNVSGADLLTLKTRSCPLFSESTLRDACMLRGISDAPADSPLFQTSSNMLSHPIYQSNGLSQSSMTNQRMDPKQAESLLLHGVNQTLLKEFRDAYDNFGVDIPIGKIQYYFSTVGINAMLHVIESVPSFPGIFPFCHQEGHNLGIAVLTRSPNLEVALNICGRACSIGCFHGAMVEFFHAMYRDAPIDLADDVLRAYYVSQGDEKASILTVLGEQVMSVLTPHIIHGLGHAIMMTIAKENYKKATEECKLISEPLHQFNCASAVYMEHFHLNRPNFTNTGLSPCNHEDTDYPAGCYHFLWIYLALNMPMETAQNICLNIRNDNERHGCFNGVGVGYSQKSWKAKKKVTSLTPLCSKGDVNDQRTCLQGAMYWPGPYSDNSTLRDIECAVFPASLHHTCTMFGSDKYDEPSFSIYHYTAEMRAAEKANTASAPLAGRKLRTQ